MRRAVTIELDRFVVDALAGEEGRGRAQTPLVLVQAIRCYLNDRYLERTGWLYPAFLREKRTVRGVELELSIDEALLRALEDEAGAQDVTMRQMAEHAALYYAAERDAGRITRRILDDFEGGERR
jgi:hypothetical protein